MMSQRLTDPQPSPASEPSLSAPNPPVEEPSGGLFDPRRLMPGPGEPPLLLPEPPTRSGPDEGNPDKH